MARPKPPPVLFVDLDLTDNVPLHPGPEYQQILGREHILFAGHGDLVLLVPRQPLRAPSSWGML